MQKIPLSILKKVPSPSFVVDEVALQKNLSLLKHIQEQTQAKIILALKGFAMFCFADLILQYLPGTTASSLNEALLAKNDFGGEVHTCAPAYHPLEIQKILEISNHITFNSFSEFQRYKALLKNQNIKVGLRINPEHSEVATKIYDPCAKDSRLGIKLKDFENQNLDGISGLHFHTLCELGSDALQRTLKVVEEKFGKYFHQIDWINFGGGHHITRNNYDTKLLISLLNDFHKRYPHIQVYMEPGEAIGLNTGVLVTSVLDILNQNDSENAIAILDSSATCHMPDVLEMPYRPYLYQPNSFDLAGNKKEKAYTYQLGGTSCLAGDRIGDYSFDKKLQVGDKLVFLDMAHYTMVKTTMFNGVNLPSLVKCHSLQNTYKIIKTFGYQDYKSRLS